MKSWSDYVDLLKPAAELLEMTPSPHADAMQAALYRQFAMNLAQGYFLYFQSNPDHPEFMPFENSVFLAQPNPDAVYYYSPVDGSGTYRVTGERGNAPVAGFAIGNSIIGTAATPGKGLGNYDIDALQLRPDGTFEVIFSTERPTGHTGNWLHLHPDADFILVRQFCHDWGREVDMRLAIERINAPALKPAMTPAEIDRRLVALFGGYVRNLSSICLQAVKRTHDKGFVNRMQINTYQELGNSGDWPQAYFETVFQLAEDEALILETELPQTRPYWNVQVVDALWNQVELVYRQSSLNGVQAKVDADGMFRAVLAHQDPGVHNWLDTGGNKYGMLIGRWYRCNSHPVPALRVVKFAALNGELPDGSARCTEAERAHALRQRRLGAQLRRRW